MVEKITYDIVKFKNGKFGYRKTTTDLFLFKNYQFLGTDFKDWWSMAVYINARCMFDSKKEIDDFLGMERKNKADYETLNVLDIGVPLKKVNNG